MRDDAPISPGERAPAPGEAGLFRSEALAEGQSQWLGRVLIVPRVSHAALAAFAALAGAGVVGLLFFADHTRTARVGGRLAPQAGVIQVFAPQSGVLARLHVSEGSEVSEGAPLALISAELRSEALGATGEQVAQRLRERLDSMRMERTRQERLAVQRDEALSGRLAAMEEEGSRLEEEIALQRERLALAERTASRQRELRGRNLATELNLREAEADELDQALRLRALERSRAGFGRERLALEAELREAPLQAAMRLAEIDRASAALEQELAEAEARRRVVLAAPEDGVVTAIQGATGGGVAAGTPLLSILPAGSALEARLYGPSRAIGFVRPGQRVRLRYEAFPYQKFGHHEGVVAAVSRAAVAPAEPVDQARGDAEPAYRITVALARQSVTAYGEEVPLQPGMAVEADVEIETRRLIEWVLDPLYTLTGRWRA